MRPCRRLAGGVDRRRKGASRTDGPPRRLQGRCYRMAGKMADLSRFVIAALCGPVPGGVSGRAGDVESRTILADYPLLAGGSARRRSFRHVSRPCICWDHAVGHGSI